MENIAKKRFELTNKTIDELDTEMWIGSPYEGMPFKRLESWDMDSDHSYNYIKYASPRFQFENGDVLVISKTGEIIKL